LIPASFMATLALEEDSQFLELCRYQHQRRFLSSQPLQRSLQRWFRGRVLILRPCRHLLNLLLNFRQVLFPHRHLPGTAVPIVLPQLRLPLLPGVPLDYYFQLDRNHQFFIRLNLAFQASLAFLRPLPALPNLTSCQVAQT
jgi:hypothetical protein